MNLHFATPHLVGQIVDCKGCLPLIAASIAKLSLAVENGEATDADRARLAYLREC